MVNVQTNHKLDHSDVRRQKAKSKGLFATLVVRRAARTSGNAPLALGHLRVGHAITLPCALGATGITVGKREGDKATPAGRMRLLHGYYRSDRLGRPRSLVPLRPLRRSLGWCDEPGSPLYNRPIPAPVPQSHETMWRVDGLYDVVLVLDYNLRPRRRGRGSAIFLHCASPGLKPTLGCIALRPDDMRRLLPRLARTAVLTVM